MGRPAGWMKELTGRAAMKSTDLGAFTPPSFSLARWISSSAATVAQAKTIAAELKAQGRYVEPDREVVALIAYLQSLGQTSQPVTPAAGTP